VGAFAGLDETVIERVCWVKATQGCREVEQVVDATRAPRRVVDACTGSTASNVAGGWRASTGPRVPLHALSQWLVLNTPNKGAYALWGWQDRLRLLRSLDQHTKNPRLAPWVWWLFQSRDNCSGPASPLCSSMGKPCHGPSFFFDCLLCK
jgi:hypothetical protein